MDRPTRGATFSREQKSTKKYKAAEVKNKRAAGGKEIDIPPGNLVLIRDHPAGRNKIQDRHKPDLFQVVKLGDRPNNYWIKPIGSDGPSKEVNRRQLFDIGVTEEGLAGRKETVEEEVQELEPAAPQFNPKAKSASPSRPNHTYNLRERPKPAPRKRKGKVDSSTSTLVTYF